MLRLRLLHAPARALLNTRPRPPAPGAQAEHHHRALQGIAGTRHRVDHAAQRYGILTTEDIKHAMCTLLDTMLREQRVSVMPTLLSEVSLVFMS